MKVFLDYICKDCNKITDVYMVIDEKVVIKCKYCGSTNTKRKIGLFGLTVAGGNSPNRTSRKEK